VCDGGLVLDLSPMKGIRVDPEAREVRVQPGCTWGDVDHATHAYGLAVPTGIISSTGVAGLTLGGGHGYLSRKYGLTIDNLLAADVVLANGRTVTASVEQNPDLFWALRGGGGNFGVVTSFLFRGQPVSTVQAGPTLWPIERAAEVLRWYQQFTDGAPEDQYGFFMLMEVPPAPTFPEELHARKVCGVMWCHLGTEEDAARDLQPVQELEPLLHHVTPMPLPALNSAFDALYSPGLQWYWKGDFVRELSEEAIALHAELGAALPTMHSTMHLYPIDGAVQRVGSEETAFGYRDVRWSKVIAGVDPDPANAARCTQWARTYWEALHPHTAGGAYVNFMMQEGDQRVRATYRANHERLARIKRRYDPGNLFRVNQNVEPA
jgi:hypothetical protein